MRLPLVGETGQADVTLGTVLCELGWQCAGDHPATLMPTGVASSDCDESIKRRESEANETPDEQELLENAPQTAWRAMVIERHAQAKSQVNCTATETASAASELKLWLGSDAGKLQGIAVDEGAVNGTDCLVHTVHGARADDTCDKA